jgi:hypothetical protein
MRVRARRPVTAIFAAAALLNACDAAPSAPPVTLAHGTPRPSFETPGPPSGATPEEIRAAIEPFLGRGVISVGEGANRVIGIGLTAKSEALARELNDKYGAAVELTVGLFPYPPPERPQRACVQMRQTVADHRPLVGGVAIDRTVVAGEFFRGKLRLRNAGNAPYQLETSSTFAIYLFRPGDSMPIGSPEGGSVGTGFGTVLAAGQAVDLDAAGGTASCDLALGYVLPAGTYEARALVDYSDPQTLEPRYFWTEATVIDVVNPQ